MKFWYGFNCYARGRSPQIHLIYRIYSIGGGAFLCDSDGENFLVSNDNHLLAFSPLFIQIPKYLSFDIENKKSCEDMLQCGGSNGRGDVIYLA